MKYLLVLLWVALAWCARAAIGLPDTEPIDAAPAIKKRPIQNENTPPSPKAKTTAAPVTIQREPREGVIRFRNGDTLHGTLVGITPAGQLEWRTSVSAEPLRLSLQTVMQITLAGVAATTNATGLVTLTNGDKLRGNVTALDGETLTLDTWYAGTMKLKRTMVRQISAMRAGEGIVFEGFSSIDSWQRGSGAEAWQLRGGVLSATQPGAIGRDVGLPDRACVEFSLAWQQFPAVQICLYGKRAGAIPGDGSQSGYWLMLMGSSAQLQRVQQTETTPLGQTDISRFLRAGKVRLALYVDKAKRTFTLVADGQLVKTWTDANEFAGDGTCLTFVAHAVGGNQGVRLSNLRVRNWVGELDSGAPVVAGKQDVLCLANNDRVTGQLKSIHQGTVSIVSTVATLDIPLERVAEIYLATEEAERARRMAADVIAVFNDGGRVTLALESLDERTIAGHSENFGKLNLAREAFRELQLQIYDDARGEDEADSPPTQPGLFPFFDGE